MEAYRKIYKIIVRKGPDISWSQNSVAIWSQKKRPIRYRATVPQL